MIHPTAIIDPAASLDDGVDVGAYSVIGPGVTIAKGTTVGPHVVISGVTNIGKNNRIYQFASIGEDPQDLKYDGEETVLTIGDGNTFREFTTIHRGTATGIGKTIIGDDGLFMAYVHIAHDCVVGNNVVFSNAASLAGHVEVGEHAILAGFSLVHQFGRIGEHSFAGMGSVLNRDLPPYVLASGNPARAVGINKEGLKRRGFDPEAIQALHNAFRTKFKAKNKTNGKEQLDELCKRFAEVSTFVAFVDSSKRGVVR